MAEYAIARTAEIVLAGTSEAGIVLHGVKLRAARGWGALLGDSHVAICRRR